MVCCAQWLTSQCQERFILFISSSNHTKDVEKPTETIRGFINWEATYGRQLFTSVLRIFSTELGGESHLIIRLVYFKNTSNSINKYLWDKLIHSDIICFYVITKPSLSYRHTCKDSLLKLPNLLFPLPSFRCLWYELKGKKMLHWEKNKLFSVFTR